MFSSIRLRLLCTHFFVALAFLMSTAFVLESNFIDNERATEQSRLKSHSSEIVSSLQYDEFGALKAIKKLIDRRFRQEHAGLFAQVQKPSRAGNLAVGFS